jgi:hypothetical protein
VCVCVCVCVCVRVCVCLCMCVLVCVCVCVCIERERDTARRPQDAREELEAHPYQLVPDHLVPDTYCIPLAMKIL